MTAWAETTFLFKILFILSHVALLAQLLGFATPIWVYFSDGSGKGHIINFDTGTVDKIDVHSYGLWQMCGDGGCYEISISSLPAWYGATRAFETMGFMGSLLLSIFMCLRLCLKTVKEMAKAPFITIIIASVTAGLIFLGVIIWGASVKYDLNFGFAMSCIAGIIYTVIGVISCIDCMR